MTRRLGITFLICAAASLVVIAVAAILDWSNGALGVALIATTLIIGLAREPNDRPRSSH